MGDLKMRVNWLSRSLILIVIAALGAAACAPGSTGGPVKGGTVKLIGTWTGNEQDSFMAVLQPFIDRTGIKVEYEGARDLDTILNTRVAAGSPPDLAAAPGPTLLSKFALQGKVVDLGKVLDTTQLKKDYAQVWIDLGTVNGKLVQVFSWAALKGLIWYNPKVFAAKGYTVPKTWDDMIALQAKMKTDGTPTPWCIAIESGGDSGWAGSDFHKEIAIGKVGPDVYDKWWQGKQKWTSPEIKSTFTTFGQILGPGDSNVYGGSKLVVNTNFGNVGDPMFQTPPKCGLINQASFITDFFAKSPSHPKIGEDFTFFPMPAPNSQYQGAYVGAADAWSMFHDTPQARELMKYLVTAEAQTIWVKRGGKLSPNKNTNLADYPDDLTRSIAKILVDAKIFRYDAGDLMPSDMKHAYWKGIIAFIQDQTKLDSILADLDKVQATAYTT
jgi:alpha-glucoside transport system substrate-binding protein